MWGDYLRASWRGVLHNKVATLINVGGLALGLAVFFALGFYVDREFSWDAHWDGADRIYVPMPVQESSTGVSTLPSSFIPYVVGTSLQTLRPGDFEAYTRVYAAFGTIIIDDNDYPNRSISLVEPALLDMLQLETVEGSLDDALADPGSVAVNATFAQAMFGDASPLGRTLTMQAQLGTRRDYTVRAVYRVPGPSIFATMPFLARLDETASPQPNTRLDLWQFEPPPTPPQPGGAPQQGQSPLYVSHYFKLRPGVDIQALERDFRNFLDEGRFTDTGNSKIRYVFRNMRELYLQPSPFQPGDNVQRLLVYAAIGVLVLLISGCNFVMLATLRLADRMREVGIRKSVGGGAPQLMGQYLLDAFLHTLVAAILAIAFLALAFPKLAPMLELPLELDLLTPRNLGLCLALVVLFTLLSSFYPAWLTAQAKPAPLLRNGAGAVVGTGTRLRKLLVGIQFAIVVVLLLASGVVHQQIEYTRTRDPGYSLDNVIASRIGALSGIEIYRTIVTELNRLPGVDVAAVGSVSPGTIMISSSNPVTYTDAEGRVREGAIQVASIGPEYMRAMSVRIVAGREFTAEDEPPTYDPSAPPTIGKAVLNEAAVRALGFATPDAALDQLIETQVSLGTQGTRKNTMRVIGVVADTQFSSAMLPPVAQYYTLSLQNGFLAVKLQPGADRATVLEAVEETWEDVAGRPFQAADEALMTGFQLRREELEGRIVTGSTALAIVIALLGLYGLVAATVVKRVKEIGVRKVMGAERTSIVTLFLWQFSKPIVIANVIAWPFGFWAIKQWLTRFPYQLDTFVIVMSGLAASLVALLIAWLTVGAMAARAASVNPVRALRYE